MSNDYEIDPDFVDWISGGQFELDFQYRMNQKRLILFHALDVASNGCDL
jgi:hypothetical protein